MVLIEAPRDSKAQPSGPPAEHSGRARMPSTRWWTFVGLITAVQLLVRWWTVVGLDQFQDDVFFTYRALESPPDQDFLFTMYDGHWGPVVTLLQWVTVNLDPFDVGTAYAVVFALLLLADIGVALMLKGWIGTRGSTLAWYVFWAASPVAVSPLGSWSVGVALLPVAGATAWLAWLHARALRSGMRRDALLALGSLCLLVLTSPRALIAVPFLALTSIAYPAVLGYASTGSLLRRTWRYWAAVGLILAAYLVVYWSSDPNRSTPKATLESFVTVLDHAVVRTAFPALIGGPWLSESGALPSVGALDPFPLSLVAQIVAVVALITVALRREAWRAWAILAALTLMQAALMTATVRYDILGEALLRQTRYLLPLLVPAVLLLALAFSQGELRPWAARLFTRLPWLATVLTVAAVLVFVESSWLTTYRLVVAMKSASTHTFWANARDSFDQEPDAVIIDRQMPDGVVVPGFFEDLGSISEGLRYFVTDQRFDIPAESHRYLTDEGLLVDAELEPFASSPPGPAPGCGYLLEPGGSVRVPLYRSEFGYRWGVRVHYLAGGDATLIAEADGTTTELSLPGGLGSITWISAGVIDSVRFRLADRQDPAVCIDHVVVGGIVPGDGAP